MFGGHGPVAPLDPPLISTCLWKEYLGTRYVSSAYLHNMLPAETVFKSPAFTTYNWLDQLMILV